MFFGKKDDDFARFVKINKLPILILDETFNYVFKNKKTERMLELEEEIKELLKEQGRLNEQCGRLEKSKKIRLSKILNLSGELNEKNSSAAEEMGKNQNTVGLINDEIENMKKRLSQLPLIIDEKNYELFSEAVKISYNDVSKISSKIKKLEPELQKLRAKLKEKTDIKDVLDDEYKEKSLFLRKFIGHEGIQILDERFDGKIK